MRQQRAVHGRWSIIPRQMKAPTARLTPDLCAATVDSGPRSVDYGLWTVDCEPPPPDSKPESFRGCVPALDSKLGTLDYRAFLSLLPANAPHPAACAL